MATLGISTNTRLLGWAIINAYGLSDYKMCHFKPSWSPSKVTEIIACLEPCVRRCSIKRVVLSMPHEYHQTREFKILIARICDYFEEQQIPVYTEKVQALYSFCPEGEKKTKKTMMKAMTQRFEELNYFYYRETRRNSNYYVKLFEAITVAAIHQY